MSADLAIRLARAALEGVDPRRCTAAAIERAGAAIDRPCTLFAFGKAARGMAEAALARAPVRDGIVIAPDPAPIGALRVLRGGHPLPDDDAAAHGEAVLALAGSLGEDDLALVLPSGGGSAMLEAPVPGVSAAAIADATRALMRAGADIAELNAVRRCLSRIKGGGLARAIHPARTVVIVVSDVAPHPPSLVASGPCASPEGWPDPREVIARLGVRPALPREIADAVEARAAPGLDPATAARVETHLAADVGTAIAAVTSEAASLGLAIGALDAPLAGEAREEALRFVARARDACAARGLDGAIAGGETVVTVRGGGRGGRNLEAALALAADPGALGGGTFVALATDGVDGTSDAAGAWIDPAAAARARAEGLDPRAYLDANDAAAFFERLGTALSLGPTGTNVADVWLWLRARDVM